MRTLPGYQNFSLIHESTKSLVYRCVRNLDNLKVIHKVLRADYPTPEELTRYKQEYEILRNLNLEGVVKAYDLQKYQNNLVVVLEDFGGESLKILISKKKFTLEEFLLIAAKTVENLSQIHQANIIHKDINPSNLVFNSQTGQIKLIDFGISTVLTRENPTLKNPDVLEGTLTYMSPEQTGRMNRSLDYRTDFYSLGATFYELLTHQVPFESPDAMELVHCHIAKQPVPPHKLNATIPKTLSDIVMKLLAKTAEDRYQSAYGIKADLEYCLSQLQTDGQITEFPLGREDFSDKFHIPQKLYGRQGDINTLLTAFEQVSQGKTQMMLVSGYSGIGKSSLVQEIYKPLTQRRAYFISGKFDQFQRNIPYSAIVNAFQSLVRQLLTESEARLNQWKEKLLAAFGSNGKVIIDVIPELELIVGSQPPVQELGPTESQNRFNLVFQNFIRVFCQAAHPLVIFLDDLQWADLATLNLVKLMMTDSDTQYLFLIGAYRDNEVSTTHPLIITINELINGGSFLNQITLSPLKIEHITQLVADTLHENKTSVKTLSDLILNKTLGNPFFVNEFLNYLFQENLLVFNFEKLIWDWNTKEIELTGITENVVELMINRLKKLPSLTQQILSFCACVGNYFHLTTLSTVCEKPAKEVFQELLPAIQLGLILTTSDLETIDCQDINSPLLIFKYKFLHDRVQQAAYALIDRENKKSVHLKIGRLLLADTSLEDKSERLFEIVDHLNVGQELIVDEIEKVTLAKLNLEAGQKAKDAAAYAAAKEYLMASMNGLTDNSWHKYYELTLILHKELAEVEFLNRNIENSEDLINLTLSRAKSSLEKAEVYRLSIMLYSLTGKPEQAIEAGRKGLALLGVDLPKSDLPKVLDNERAKAEKSLGNKDIASLIEQPEIQSASEKMAAKLLVDVDPAAYFVNQELYSIVVLKSVNLYLKHGNVPEAAKGYSTYGILLGSIWGDYQSGYEFGSLALKVSEKFNNLGYKSKACFILANFLNSWVKPIANAEAINSEGFSAGMESGDIPYAGYTLLFQPINAFYQGIELKQVAAKLANTLEFFQKYKNQWSYDAVLGLEIIILNLMGIKANKLEFSNDRITEKQYLENCNKHKSFSWICQYYIFKSQILYLYEEPEEALKCAKEAAKMLASVLGMICTSEHNFYTSLSLAALYTKVSKSKQKQYDKELLANQEQMKIWADNCPENFLHKYLLVSAEIARIKDNISEAINLYSRAIESAQKNDFIQNAALANELAAKFWLGQGQEKYAKVHMTEAYHGYQHWGAQQKVKDLEEKYSHLLTKTSLNRSIHTTTSTSHSSSSSARSLDLITVLKASQTIASEIVLDKLLASLMKISIENAGAEKGLLLLSKDGELFVEASSSVKSEEVVVRQYLPIHDYHNLPKTVINYVRRTSSNLILHNAAIDVRFANDTYIATNKLKSILCIPIINQGVLTAILYLENNLTIGAFTPDRLEVLKLLCSQAAISIENALLYSIMEEKVQERTRQLNEKNTHLEQTLHELKNTQTQLIQTEKMSSLGQLVAGIAHEINNPVNFIYGNLNYVNEYAQNLLRLLNLYIKHYPEPVTEIQEEVEAIELNFLAEDLPKMLSSMKIGADRIREIVLSLRNFSRLDEADMKSVNIHEGLDSTLLILQNRTKAKPDRPVIEVIKEYDKLPNVECYVGQLNQVFMNILSNACDAMEDKIKAEIKVSNSKLEPLVIRIRTSLLDNNRVAISIADNGFGMKEEVKKRVFDPFFTTKPIGKGTGLGLAISYQIVVEKHRGNLLCNSELGKGTEFTIEIPIRQQS